MSSAKHTEGRLRPEPQEEYYGNDGDTRPTGMGLVSVSDGDLVVATVNDFYSDGSEGRTNAARLAACWNACEGMEDPESEIAHLRARVLELEKVEADLLATCKDHEAEVVADEAVAGDQALRDEVVGLRAQLAEAEGQLDDIDSYTPQLYGLYEGTDEVNEDAPVPLVERVQALAERCAEAERKLDALSSVAEEGGDA